MNEILSFFIVLIAALLFSELFKRLHLPWVVALIIGGIIIGPSGINLFVSDITTDFLAEIGLVFLMFMAGLETKLSDFRRLEKGKFSLPLLNGGLPFLVLFAIGLYFGFEINTAALLGVIFISSSVAVILPSLEKNSILKTKLGRTIVSTTILEDVASLVLLSIFLQTADPITNLPLPAFYALLLSTLIALRWLIPKVREFFIGGKKKERDVFERELRTIFTILIGTVISFELLGLHAIIAGFFAGFVLSESIKSKELKAKLRVLSYGLFIPIFFVVVGSKTDLSAFLGADNIIILTVALVLGVTLSKFIAGMIAGRINGLNLNQGALIGVATIPQLSTSLAVVFTGFDVGLLSNELVTSLVAVTVATTLISPMLVRFIVSKSRVETK